MARGNALIVAAVVALLFLFAVSGSADAQLQPANAQIVKATGPLEVLRKGQVRWLPGTVGGRLAEGDQIRALSGGSGELSLPDGSTILVAENTRFVVTKLEYDPQTRDRNAAFHLAAGKVRAQVQRAAVQLVRARQSNFTISSPAGVAAIRGTIAVFAYNPETRQGLLFVLPSPGQPAAAAQVTYFNFATNTSVTVGGNQFITQVANQLPSAPTPISNLPPNVQQQIETPANPATATSAALTAPTVVIVSAQQIQAVLTTLGIQAAVAPPATPGLPSATTTTTSTLARDIAQTCASPPCP